MEYRILSLPILLLLSFFGASSAGYCEGDGSKPVPVPGTNCTEDDFCAEGFSGPTFMTCQDGQCACQENQIWNRDDDEQTGSCKCSLVHNDVCRVSTSNPKEVQPCYYAFKCYVETVNPSGTPAVEANGTCLCANEELTAVEGRNQGVEYYPEAMKCFENVKYLGNTCDPLTATLCYPFTTSICSFSANETSEGFACGCVPGYEMTGDMQDCEDRSNSDDSATSFGISILAASVSTVFLALWS